LSPFRIHAALEFARHSANVAMHGATSRVGIVMRDRARDRGMIA